MRFKIDENLPVEAALSLRNAGHDVLTIHDQQMVGDPDPQVAVVCKSEQREIISLDLDFLIFALTRLVTTTGLLYSVHELKPSQLC